MELFEKRFIDRVFEKTNKKSITVDKFGKFLGETLGKRVEKEVVENKIFSLPKTISLWACLQILTYYTSHKIKDQYRVVNSQRRLINEFM